MLYAIHLNDNSLFCVFTSLDVICSPNSRFITETMVAFLKTRSIVDANLTYLDSLNRYVILCYYKALTGLSEKRLVSTKPCIRYGMF